MYPYLPVIYTIKPGLEREKRCNKYHSHLAFELRNKPGSKVSVKTDIYSLGYLFRKIADNFSNKVLQSIPTSMMNEVPYKRPELFSVVLQLNKL